MFLSLYYRSRVGKWRRLDSLLFKLGAEETGARCSRLRRLVGDELSSPATPDGPRASAEELIEMSRENWINRIIDISTQNPQNARSRRVRTRG